MLKLTNVFLSVFLAGCATTATRLIGEPVYFKNINEDVFWESIVVYGELREQVLRKPTGVYGSSFGHAYCMVEKVSYEAQHYIRGEGPDLIEFSQHRLDPCQPLAMEVGFGQSILFLSRNKHRGVWSDGAVRIEEIDGEPRIYKPGDILYFASFPHFGSFLSVYEQPLEWVMPKDPDAEYALESLKTSGVLDYRLSEDDDFGQFYEVEMYKYIKMADLLK